MKDGVLVSRSGNDGTWNYLLSERDYADFTLNLEFRLEKRAVAGITVRALPGERLPMPDGTTVFDHPLIRLIGSSGRGGMGTTHWLTGSIEVQPDQPARLRPEWAWNELSIEVKGRNLRAFVNGGLVVDKTAVPGYLLAGNVTPGMNRVKGRRHPEASEDRELPQHRDQGTSLDRGRPGRQRRRLRLPLQRQGHEQAGRPTPPSSATGGSRTASSSVRVPRPATFTPTATTKTCTSAPRCESTQAVTVGFCVHSGVGPVSPARSPKFPHGYEAQINSTHADAHRTGTLFAGVGVPAVKILESLVPPDQWCTIELIAEGNHLVVKVNGKTTADYTDALRLYTTGRIALQQHDPKTRVEFRKVEVKELKPSANAGTSRP